MYKHIPHRRYKHTLKFLNEVLPAPATILDLGIRNPFTLILENNGYTVFNTNGEDLDNFPEVVNNFKVDAVCAFEILEHLVAPYNVLRLIKSNKLIVTVPLKLWFVSAYRSKTDLWDRHYHEFEDWQFDWLLEKSGWKIEKKSKWKSPISKLGIRPLLRLLTNRYYAIYAVKNKL